MRNVLAIQAVGLTDGILYFSDEEVEDEIVVAPRQEVVHRRTQAGDQRTYYKGGVHYEAEIPVRIARYDTLLKLAEIFNLQAEVEVFPHLPEDPVTSYVMVWTNPEVFHERWRRGYPRANYTIRLEFREPRGAICTPPES
jgi:hypothetical protein